MCRLIGENEVSMHKRILAVDDSVSVRRMVSFTLIREGYDVVEAANGEDAIKRLDSDKIDMVITDLNMPRMNGLELLKKVREDPAKKFMPIIMLTTESDRDTVLEGKASGVTGWIIKPFTPDKLIEVVKRVMK
jgi:two-component system, chemotaxis family, chemotaxis protein CheY